MSERVEGWYHVRVGEYWTHAYWFGKGWNILGANSLSDEDFDKVGSRIPAPDERWRMVPGAPTEEMLRDGLAVLDASDNLIPAYQAMLAAAPKP